MNWNLGEYSFVRVLDLDVVNESKMLDHFYTDDYSVKYFVNMK